MLNLECCISERGEPWPDPAKPFFFRAPPVAVELLSAAGRRLRHAREQPRARLRAVALLDTLEHLGRRRIAWVGAGESVDAARAAVVLERPRIPPARSSPSPIIPPAYAAAEDRPGIAYADLAHAGRPAWLLEAAAGRGADAVLVSPHWGPNMTRRAAPRTSARAAARTGRRGRDARRRPLRARLPRRRRPRPLRPRRLPRRLRGRSPPAQRPRPALPRHARRRRPAPPRSGAAEARLLPHQARRRRGRRLDPPPLHRGVRGLRHRGRARTGNGSSSTGARSNEPRGPGTARTRAPRLRATSSAPPRRRARR